MRASSTRSRLCESTPYLVMIPKGQASVTTESSTACLSCAGEAVCALTRGQAHPQVPLVWPRVGDDVVIADGDEGAVVEECDQHQHEHW